MINCFVTLLLSRMNSTSCNTFKVKKKTRAYYRVKLVSEYDQEIPQSQNADKPCHCEEEPHNNHETPGTQTE